MAIVLDTTTKAEYDALTLASARASLVVSALSGTVVVEVFDGTDAIRASGTMAAPWATSSGATITVGEVSGSGLLVTSGGAPDANWYCQFRSGSRFVRGTFGVAGSGRDFVWSLASFQTGSRGTLGTVVMTAQGVPAVLVVPTINGATQVGQALSFNDGSWSGSPTSYTRQLESSANGSTGWTDVVGATGTGYVIAAEVVGLYLRLRVVASNAVGDGAAAYSAVTGVVTAAGAESLVTLITVTNAAASSKTNEPISIGLPLAPTALNALLPYVRVYDDDGAGGKGTALGNFQYTLTATDLGGKTRMGRLDGILPALGSSATRKLHVYASASPTPSGTAITTVDILATSFQTRVSFDIGGTVFVADARTVLASSSTWSKTASVLHGTYFSGPACTAFSGSMAPVNSASAHASGDGLRVWFHIYAYKAQAGAVSEGNPITSVVCDVVVENGAVDRVTPAHYWYGLIVERSTSLSSGTLISTDDTDPDGVVYRYAWPRLQPAATITLSGSTTGPKTITLSAGAWETDVLGAHIVNAGGDGKAIVTSRSSATAVAVYVYQAFTTTSYTSGQWAQEGVGHSYACRDRVARVWVGTKPTNVAAWGNHVTAVTTTTNGAMAYAAGALALNNHITAVASVTHSMTLLNGMKGDNAIRPFTQRGTKLIGDVTGNIGGTGDREDIGYAARWTLSGLVKYDINGRRKIFENARYFSWWHKTGLRRYGGSPSAGALGAPPRSDGGTNYTVDSRFDATLIADPSGTLTGAASSDNGGSDRTWMEWTGDIAHHPSCFYVPYLLTGDLYWLESQNMQAERTATHSIDPAYGGGYGINKTPLGDKSTLWWNDLQQRAGAWVTRDIVQAAAITPDAVNNALYSAKSYWTGRVTDTWTFAAAVAADKTGADGSDYYANAGPRWVTTSANNATAISPWNFDYFLDAFYHAYELGLTNAGWTSFAAWADEHQNSYSSADVAPDYMVAEYAVGIKTLGGFGPTRVRTWAETYQSHAWGNPYDTSRWASRTVNVTLSATSGASITATAASSMFGQGSWYVGGWIISGSGKGQITGITSATVCTISTAGTGGAAFSSTSLSNASVPGPHPLDAPADGTRTGRDVNYFRLWRKSLIHMQDRSVNVAAARAYIESASGYGGQNITTDIEAR